MSTPLKKHIITIAGRPGSGKSTTANLVAEALGYRRYSSGDFMRQMAKDRGITLLELSKIAETDRNVDTAIDNKNREVGEKETNLVIDSRLAFHWIPTSFKVYLTLDLKVAAERIHKGMTAARKESGEHAENIEDLHQKISERFASEQQRYQELYGINPQTSNFDLTIDTAEKPQDVVAKEIVEAYNIWLKN
jgi:cytidylate kinase